LDVIPQTALEHLKRFGYANLPSSHMIPLFCLPDLLVCALVYYMLRLK